MAKPDETTSTSKLLEIIKNVQDKSRPGIPDQANVRKQNLIRSSPSLFSLLFRGIKAFSFKKIDALGVDLSGGFLNLVLMKESPRGWNVLNARSIPVPRGMNLENPNFPAFLKRSLSSFTGGSDKVFIWSLIPSSRAEIWTLKAPVTKDSQSSVILWTARKQKDFNEKEYLFDYRIVGEVTEAGVRKKNVCAYIVPHWEIRLLNDVFSRAGYPPAGITLPTFALQNLFSMGIMEPLHEPYAILSIGHELSRIDVHYNGILLLSRAIKTGMDSMAESFPGEKSINNGLNDYSSHLEEGAGTSEAGPDREKGYESLRALIKKDASPGDGEFSMILPVLQRLAKQVERTFDHLVNIQGHKPVTSLYLAGLPAALTGLPAYFSEQLDIPVTSIDPLQSSRAIQAPSAIQDRMERICLAPATALALSDNVRTPNVQFTSKNLEEKKSADRINMAVVFLGMLLVLSAGFYSWYISHQTSKASSEKAALQQRLDQLRPVITREMITDMTARFQTRSLELRSLSRNSAGIAVMTEFSNLVPENISILNVRVQMDPAHAARPRGSVILDGIVRGDPDFHETALTSFMLSLDRSPLFSESDIQRSSREYFQGEGDVLRFVINISLGKV